MLISKTDKTGETSLYLPPETMRLMPEGYRSTVITLHQCWEMAQKAANLLGWAKWLTALVPLIKRGIAQGKRHIHVRTSHQRRRVRCRYRVIERLERLAQAAIERALPLQAFSMVGSYAFAAHMGK